jgi:farnesyl diphosphate synthase
MIEQELTATADEIGGVLDRLLPPVQGPEQRVVAAMRYAVLNGGKRIRPFLVMQSAALFDVPRPLALRAAAAVEMLHCYSLVHDDLPAMDNSDLRRGRPTCHKIYDDATAILAGDGLLTLAFEILGEPETHPNPAVRADLVVALARAGGAQGMVGGQMIDLEAENKQITLEQSAHLQRLKTGAIFEFSCRAGAILAQADATAHQSLTDYARSFGLAFQIADDLLDYESDAETAGKPVGIDQAAGKATFVTILGLAKARAEAERLAQAAINALSPFGPASEPLCQMARFVVNRRH